MIKSGGIIKLCVESRRFILHVAACAGGGAVKRRGWKEEEIFVRPSSRRQNSGY